MGEKKTKKSHKKNILQNKLKKPRSSIFNMMFVCLSVAEDITNR